MTGTDDATTPPATRRYRVVQWATGNVGARSLRRIIEHPAMELVGLYVHSADKAGRDAGDLAGLAPVGIAATNSIDDILALKPDCIVYMPHQCDYDEVCTLLASGANIVTTRGEFLNPRSMAPAIRERVEAACAAGGTSIHSSGSSPGFATEALPIVLASIQRRVDGIHISEFADCSSRNSPEMLFEVMEFGKAPGGVNESQQAHLLESFGPSLAVVAEAIGLPFDGYEVGGGVGVARHDVAIAAGVVPKGTVAAQRTRVSGMRGGRPLITFTANWYVSSDVDTVEDDWLFRGSGWHIRVDGDCPLDVTIGFPVAPENYAEMTPGLTAHRPVNIVPYICDAPPGILTSTDLPQIIAQFG